MTATTVRVIAGRVIGELKVIIKITLKIQIVHQDIEVYLYGKVVVNGWQE